MPAIVEGTEAAAIHPDAAADDAEDEDDEEDDTEEENGEEEEEAEKGVKKGATLKLSRRLEAGEFFFKPGSARKASGSYYTPTEIVDYLVREALRRSLRTKSAAEIERLRVIDLACGSAHFLVGAARFLGRHLFEAYRREGNGDPPAAFYPDRKLSTGGSRTLGRGGSGLVQAAHRRALPVWRRSQPRGGAARASGALDRVARRRPAAFVLRPSHPLRQLASWQLACQLRPSAAPEARQSFRPAHHRPLRSRAKETPRSRIGGAQADRRAAAARDSSRHSR